MEKYKSDKIRKILQETQIHFLYYIRNINLSKYGKRRRIYHDDGEKG